MCTASRRDIRALPNQQSASGSPTPTYAHLYTTSRRCPEHLTNTRPHHREIPQAAMCMAAQDRVRCPRAKEGYHFHSWNRDGKNTHVLDAAACEPKGKCPNHCDTVEHPRQAKCSNTREGRTEGYLYQCGLCNSIKRQGTCLIPRSADS